MADHVSLLQITDVDFASLLQKVENAFDGNCAAFYVRQTSGIMQIDVFDPANAGFTVDEWTQLGPLIPYLDQMSMFAFEGGPDSYIRNWIDDHEKGHGDVAVKRVHMMREMMPATRREWQNRAQTVGAKVIGDVRSQIMLNPDTAQWQALISFDSYLPAGPPRRQPLGGSREWVNVLVTRNDLSRMIAVLQQARALMPDYDFTVENDEDQQDEGAEG